MDIQSCHIPLIEKALEVKLYDWQKDWLINGKWMPNARGNGKTFAYCINLALSEGKPLNVQRPEDFCDSDYGPPGNKVRYARAFFRRMFFDVWIQLKDAGFPVRPIAGLKKE